MASVTEYSTSVKVHSGLALHSHFPISLFVMQLQGISRFGHKHALQKKATFPAIKLPIAMDSMMISPKWNL